MMSVGLSSSPISNMAHEERPTDIIDAKESIFQQPIKGPPNPIVSLRRDHDVLRKLWSEYNATTNNARRDAIVNEMIRGISIHDALECTGLYPELIKLGFPGAQELHDHSLEEHRKVRGNLAKLDKGDGVERFTPEFETLFQETMKDMDMHMLEEEAEIFPKMEEVISKERMTELGKTLDAHRKKVPTHPHVEAPDTDPDAMEKESKKLLPKDLELDNHRHFIDTEKVIRIGAY
jgi:hypothetical protein